MPGYIYTDGCKVLVENPSSTRALDICNCSAFYTVQVLGAEKQRSICPTEQLWNYKQGGCESADQVLSQRLCNRKLPWERCSSDTLESKKQEIKRRCIAEGRYSEAVAQQYDDKLPYLTALSLPNDVILSNLELAAAAFVAGCVITLLLLAIILTICKLAGSGTLSKDAGLIKTRNKKKKKQGNPAGDDVSLKYDDIDEGQPAQGYKPVFSGAHLQLHGDSYRDSEHQIQTVSVSTTESTSRSYMTPKHGPPSKPPPLPPNQNKPSQNSPPKRSLPVPTQSAWSNVETKSSAGKLGKVEMKIPLRPVITQKESVGYIHPR